MSNGTGRSQEGTYNTGDQLEKKSLKFIDLEKLEGVVADMEYVDKEVTNTKDKIYDAKNELDREWDGDAAEAFILQFGRLNDDLKDFESGFKDIKKLLQEASNAFRETDRDLYRQFDEAAQKQKNGGGDSGSASDPDGLKEDLYSVVEDAVEAILDAVNKTEKQEIYSTMENEDPADLTSERKQSKAELYSTMEEEVPAQLESSRRTLREEINTSTDNPTIGNVNGGRKTGRDEISSTIGTAAGASLITGLLQMRPELYSTVETAVKASLSLATKQYREELTSTLPGIYSPILSAAMRDARNELFSTMEAEYFPVFETYRREFRADPASLLFMAVYAYLASEKNAERAEEGSTAEGQISATMTESERILKTVAAQTMAIGVEGQLLGASVRVRMADAVDAVLNDMPAALGETNAAGQKAETSATLSETSAQLMKDYRNGSDTYRDVQKSILTDKTTAIMMDGAFTGKTEKEIEVSLGNQVIDQVAPGDLTWTREQRTEAAEKIGNRMMQHTWNKVSYDAARASGLTSAQTVEAVMAENAAAPEMPVS